MKQEKAFEILKTGKNVFLTGEPGSGKTHIINRYISYLRESGVEPAVTASTGIAATHIGGYTIHSWSGIGVKEGISPYELEAMNEKRSLVTRISRANILIIDEISMLDGKILDMVDMVLRSLKGKDEPFGGVQVVLSGDFFQLPPVSTGGKRTFAFESLAWKRAKPVICYIDEQFRQTDKSMLGLLRAIRTGFLNNDHRWILNERMRDHKDELPYMATKLFSHNFDVDRLNEEELKKIDDNEEIFEMESKGNKVLVEQIKRGCLSPERLVLKVGAVVMCTKNNFERGFANGTIGTVIAFEGKTRYPIIETLEGRRFSVPEAEWSIEEDGRVLAKVIQIPLRLAWAITVHKSQGVSLDSAVIDLSRSFEYGQGYVALSRVRTLEGLYCLGLNEKALLVHPSIAEMDRRFKSLSEAICKKFTSIDGEEVSRIQKDFFLSIGGGKDKKGKSFEKRKIDTYNVTKELLGGSLSIEELAEARGLKLSTIISHLEVLSGRSDISQKDLWRLWRARGGTEKDLEEIHEAFKSAGEDRLGPVRKKLGNRFGFDDIRLARMFLNTF